MSDNQDLSPVRGAPALAGTDLGLCCLIVVCKEACDFVVGHGLGLDGPLVLGKPAVIRECKLSFGSS